MKIHKFTIIIPTRERADTLYWSLKTCIAQDYENLEILVSDNFSQDNTREVVESFQDKRIRYINTGRRVEMSENWDFALKHVTEGYAGFLGDDDGYTLNSIPLINEILYHIPAPAIVWKEAAYGWPNLTNQFRDILYVQAFNRFAELKSTKQELRKFGKNQISYKQLVSIYPNGFILIDTIKKYLSRKELFFRCTSPDLFSAILLAHIVDSYVYVNIPLSVSGGSAKSNASVNQQAIQTFVGENKLNAIHSSLGGEYFSSWSFLMADSIFHVKEFLGDLPKEFIKKRIPKVIEHTIKEYTHLPKEGYEKAAIKMAQLAAIHSINIKYVNDLLHKHPNQFNTHQLSNSPSYSGWQPSSVTLEASKIHINNIYDACLFISQLARFKSEKVQLVRHSKSASFLLEASRFLTRLVDKYFSKALV